MSAKVLVLRRWTKPVLDRMSDSGWYEKNVSPELPLRNGKCVEKSALLKEAHFPSTKWSTDDVRLCAGMITVLDRNVEEERENWLDLVVRCSDGAMTRSEADEFFYTCTEPNTVEHVQFLLDQKIRLHRKSFQSLFQQRRAMRLGRGGCLPVPETPNTGAVGKRKRSVGSRRTRKQSKLHKMWMDYV
jgi:hypothetical protein